MPKLRIFVFLGLLILFAAIPLLGKKEEASVYDLPSFQVLGDDSSFMFEESDYPEVGAQLTPGVRIPG